MKAYLSDILEDHLKEGKFVWWENPEAADSLASLYCASATLSRKSTRVKFIALQSQSFEFSL